MAPTTAVSGGARERLFGHPPGLAHDRYFSGRKPTHATLNVAVWQGGTSPP